MSSARPAIALVGGHSMLGQALLALLAVRRFPLRALHVLDEAAQIGEEYSFTNSTGTIADVAQFDFSQVELVFFATEAASMAYTEVALAAGCQVIDHSLRARQNPELPLIVPEVNLARLAMPQPVIASPDPLTVQLAVALQPIRATAGIAQLHVATYQAVSSSGQGGLEELARQTALLLNGRPIQPQLFNRQIAFNVLPQVDQLLDNGYTRQEMSLVQELRRVFDDPALAVHVTAVQVPVFHGHALAVHLRTRTSITVSEVHRLLTQQPGLRISGAPSSYPTPATEATQGDDIYIGRIRADLSDPQGLNLWIVADDLRRGGALNSIQIAEFLIKNF
jgi:aspartate-semialdehyde dehydrogenase